MIQTMRITLQRKKLEPSINYPASQLTSYYRLLRFHRRRTVGSPGCSATQTFRTSTSPSLGDLHTQPSALVGPSAALNCRNDTMQSGCSIDNPASHWAKAVFEEMGELNNSAYDPQFQARSVLQRRTVNRLTSNPCHRLCPLRSIGKDGR